MAGNSTRKIRVYFPWSQYLDHIMPKETCFKKNYTEPDDLAGYIVEHPSRGVGLITGYLNPEDDDGMGFYSVLWSSGDSEYCSESIILESRLYNAKEVTSAAFGTS